jgi:hypothetical protein
METTTTTTSTRPLSARIGFHFAASFSTGVAAVGGVVATIFAAFAIGHCGESGANLLRQYRQALALITFVAAAVPTFWAFLARRMKMAWQPWAVTAACVLGYGMLTIVNTHHFEGFCMF